jgi:hypothetical protein
VSASGEHSTVTSFLREPAIEALHRIRTDSAAREQAREAVRLAIGDAGLSDAAAVNWRL